MKREEAIGIWLPMVLLAVNESTQCAEAVKMATRALAQEPIIDKIIAEIDAHREKLKIMADDDWYAGKIRGYDCAIEIIDKYKAESEE